MEDRLVQPWCVVQIKAVLRHSISLIESLTEILVYQYVARWKCFEISFVPYKDGQNLV
jgi:hypothetical protein